MPAMADGRRNWLRQRMGGYIAAPFPDWCIVSPMTPRSPRHDTLAAQRPLDALWQPSTLLWVLVAGEGLAALLALGPGILSDRWIYFGLTSLVVQWILVLALVGLYCLRSHLRKLRPTRVAYVALAMLLAAAWLVFGAMWWLLGRSLFVDEASWLRLMLRLSGIVLIVGLLGLAAFQNHWRARQLAVRAKQSELEALRARIRPHFLFNTLNSGIALVRQQPQQVEQLLLSLSDLFRAALANPHSIELAEEIDLARRYLEIEAIRFGPRLTTHWQLPDPIPSAMVPALSIQPLVENAVRHGIERLREGGEIGIKVAVADGIVTVSVRNRIPRGDQRSQPGYSLGQHATRTRLLEMTGGRGGLVSSEQDGFYVAEMRLPLEAGAGSDP